MIGGARGTAPRRDRRARRRPLAAAQERDGRGVAQTAVVEGKRVAVVVPAYKEELLVADTIRGIPDFVDMIVVVDDCSSDATAERARATRDPRLEVIEHGREPGRRRRDRDGLRALPRPRRRRDVRDGGRQPDGSRRARARSSRPVARGETDYAKANRLVSGEAWQLIPRSRYLGNAVLSLLTKIASGLLARGRLAGRVTRRSRSTRCAASTSTVSIAATGFRTTCSST